MKTGMTIVLLTACAFALAEPQLTFESAWPGLGQLHGSHSGGATLHDRDQEYYMQEIEVPKGTEFSMVYILPPGGRRFFIQTPPLPFLKDLTPFVPFAPRDPEGAVPWAQ